MDDLNALYRVQELDTRIAELRARDAEHALRGELAELGERSDAAQAELERAEGDLEESRKKQRGMGDQVQALDEKLAREEDKLYGGKVTSPKELRGLEAEVRSLKRKKDELKAHRERLFSHGERLRAERDEKKRELDAEVVEIRAEVERLEGERDGMRQGVDEEALDLYDALRESRNNLAVVRVVDGVCQGCRVELPGMEYDRFLKSDGVFTCSNCGRILIK